MKNNTAWTLPPEASHLAKHFGTLQQVFSLQGELITRDRLSEVIKYHCADGVFYIKKYRLAGKGIRRFLGRPRIQCEWQNMLWFQQHAIPTAEVIGYGMEKSRGLFVRGALITREIPNTQDLATLALADDARLKNEDWVATVSQQAAQILRRMHAEGFVHHDFKWRNLLVDDLHRLYVIDCPHGAIWWGALFRYRRIKELGMLDRVAKYKLRQTQRLRFFLDYRGHDTLTLDDKRILRQLLARKVRRVSSFAPK